MTWALVASFLIGGVVAGLSVAGWGRLSSGAHYQTDVAVGATVGLVARKACQ